MSLSAEQLPQVRFDIPRLHASCASVERVLSTHPNRRDQTAERWSPELYHAVEIQRYVGAKG